MGLSGASTPCFEIERSINGQGGEQRGAVRQELSAPWVAADLESWMREQRAKLSRSNEVVKATEYMLKRWSAFTHTKLRMSLAPQFIAARVSR
jgi:Transposase IS66 family